MGNGLRRASVLQRKHLIGPRATSWREAFGRATFSGAVAAGATSVGAALAGARDSGSAIAPLNATSHIAWGESAGNVETVDARHTLLGLALNLGACVFWATFFEKYFGRATRRGDVGAALAGAGAVAATAYVTDYHIVPKRLTPGWESRISGPSLAAVYTALAVSLAMAGLLRRR